MGFEGIFFLVLLLSVSKSLLSDSQKSTTSKNSTIQTKPPGRTITITTTLSEDKLKTLLKK